MSSSFSMARSHSSESTYQQDMEDEDNHQQAAAPPWPDLPKDLWKAIGGRLDTCIDFLRFRSVCSSWRNLAIPCDADHPKFPLAVPSLTSWNASASASASLVRFIVYRLEPADDRASPTGWLIKVDELPSGLIRLISLVSKRPIKYKHSNFPKSVNLTEFRVSEVCREYSIRIDSDVHLPDFPRSFVKVVFHQDSPLYDMRSCVAFAVLREGGLRYWRYGDNRWKAPDQEATFEVIEYDDLVIRDRQVYAVDRLGTVHWIDPCCRAVQFSPSMCGGGRKKHLLEFHGDLYVLDRYEEDYNSQNHRHPMHCCYVTIDFRMYRLDQEWGRWDQMNELRGMVVFIGEFSSFCVTVEGFPGCGENQIYFTGRSRCGLFEGKVYVFDFVDHSIKRLVSAPECWRTLWPIF